MDIQCLASDLQSMLSPGCLISSDSAVEHYNTILSVILEKHAPSIHHQIVIRPNTEWFTFEMKAAKGVCMKLERQYNRTGLTVHQDMYKHERNQLHLIGEKVEVSYYNRKIEPTSNQKDLFRLIASISGSSPVQHLPQSSDSKTLTDRIAKFFVVKIDNIRNAVESITPESLPVYQHPEIQQPLTTFGLLSEQDIDKLLGSI